MIKIAKNNINATDLSKYRLLSSIDHNEFYGDAGNQHYKLLANLSNSFDDKIILDIGTHRGASATALSYNLKNQIYSFDIEDRIKDSVNSPKSINTIKFNQVNLFNDLERNPWEQIILNSYLIFLDIDPHEGLLEYEFYLWLKEKKYQGVLIFDDILYFENMKKNLWSKINNEIKEDITHLGHWSGTGAIQFNKIFEFEEKNNNE